MAAERMKVSEHTELLTGSGIFKQVTEQLVISPSAWAWVKCLITSWLPALVSFSMARPMPLLRKSRRKDLHAPAKKCIHSTNSFISPTNIN